MVNSSRIPRLLILSAVLVSLFLPHTVSAELPPVVVSATRSEQSAVSTPANILVIDAEEIAASGARHIVEVLQQQAMIQIKDFFGDGSRATLDMRGFGSTAASNTLVLVDGRRLNNADMAGPDLNSIALKDVERIEIIDGGAGVLFGDQAVGGVINIITRTPKDTEAYAQVELGSFQTSNLRASYSARRGDTGLRLSGEQLNTDNYRRHNEQRYSNLMLRLDRNLRSSDVFFEYQYTDEQLQLPGGLSSAELAVDRRQANSFYPDDVNNVRTDVARFGLRRPLAGDWLVEAELTNRDADADGIMWGGNFIQTRDHLGFTPRLIGALPATHGTLLLTLGLDLDEIDYRFNTDFSNTDASQSMQAWYAQAVWPLTPRLNATLGARTAKVEYDILNNGTASTLDNSATAAELGLSMQISPGTRLFTRWDRNFRFAKIDENTYTSPGVIGLEPQTGNAYELGGEWRNNIHRLKLTLYQLDLENEIAFDNTAPSPGWFPGANANLDPTRRRGLLLEDRMHVSDALGLRVQYNYIDAEFSGGSYEGNTIPFVAEHNLTLAGDYQITPRWQLHAEARYTGERYQDSDYDNALAKLPSVTVINLATRYQQGPVSVGLRINNLTNRIYNGYAVFDAYYPAPERHARVDLRYDF